MNWRLADTRGTLMYNSEFLRNKALELIVSATIELEDTGQLTDHKISLSPASIMLEKVKYTTTIVVLRRNTLTIIWCGNTIVLNRATSEEDYFQIMCVDDNFCNEEFEIAIKEFYDLYHQWFVRQLAIGGFKEGMYDDDIATNK